MGLTILQMFMFIKSQTDIVGRILRLIECPAFVDLLFRIIQLDEYSAAVGVLEVCSLSLIISTRPCLI